MARKFTTTRKDILADPERRERVEREREAFRAAIELAAIRGSGRTTKT
jgi:NifB/MoaA-like Fe-S oxidoreductase